jgi:hypothetical protein
MGGIEMDTITKLEQTIRDLGRIVNTLNELNEYVELIPVHPINAAELDGDWLPDFTLDTNSVVLRGCIVDSLDTHTRTITDVEHTNAEELTTYTYNSVEYVPAGCL